MPFPRHLLAQLGVWHHVPFLRSPKTRELLARIQWTSSAPRAVAAFETLVDGNYSFFLFQEIEQAKSRLSEYEDAVIEFHKDEIDMREPITRAEFEQLIAADQVKIERCMHRVLHAAGLQREDVQSVFLTGGSAQIPALRRTFAEQFGEAKLKAHDYLTTVASGLGLTALQSLRSR